MNKRDLAIMVTATASGFLLGYLLGRNKTLVKECNQNVGTVGRVVDVQDPEYKKLKEELLVRVNQYFGAEKIPLL